MSAPEFSRMVDLRSITTAPVKLVADEGQRAALAKRFGLVEISKLEASVMLQASGRHVSANGQIEAQFVQSCAISGDDLPASVSEKLALTFIPEAEWADEEADEVELDEAELDHIPYAGTAFDLGEAVAQSLALAIDPYATGPDAEEARQRAGIIDENTPSGPLAEALAALKKN